MLIDRFMLIELCIIVSNTTLKLSTSNGLTDLRKDAT